jgi:hypothetical protein
MTNKIDQKIVGYKVKTDTAPEETPTPVEAASMHEGIKRPDILFGSTYKIKPPAMDKALYVTINNYELDGVEHPYEIFFNSKEMDHFQWATSLTRVISAVFRKGGDVTFLVDELKEVFDPKGGYWNKGVFVPSLVAEIGYVIERHLKASGYIAEEVDTHMEAFIAKKREEVLGAGETEYPESATVCPKCNAKAVVLLDGCQTCLECGDSKCN